MGSIFGSDVTSEANPAWDCSAPPLPSLEGALSLALEAARGEGGVPSDGPARSGQRAALTWLHARLGLIFYSHFSRGCGGAGRGPGEKSNLPVTEPGVRGRRRDRIHRERLSEA